jgi:hypothetical protein
LTRTLPAVINVSQARREPNPARESIFCKRSSIGEYYNAIDRTLSPEYNPACLVGE